MHSAVRRGCFQLALNLKDREERCYGSKVVILEGCAFSIRINKQTNKRNGYCISLRVCMNLNYQMTSQTLYIILSKVLLFLSQCCKELLMAIDI